MTSNDLRQMVRDVLREVVPQNSTAASGVETVRIETDADLMAFALRAIGQAAVIKSGRLRFTLASRPPASVTYASEPAVAGNVLRGVITEHVVNRHAGSGVLVLAADAVITPLAHDRARKLKLKIERRS